MDYKLALELKEAGFPQFADKTGCGYWYTEKSEVKVLENKIVPVEPCYVPTLDELIEACGLNTFTLERLSGGSWHAYQHGNPRSGEGSTPTIAVARLWLALNKKSAKL